jgi:hypothetical protein
MWLSAAFAIVALVGGGVAYAQEQTSAIEGVVADKAGAPLPGAMVEATGPFGTLTAIAGTDGAYRLPIAHPGSYKLKASLEGFTPSAVADLTVVLGKVQHVNFTLNPAAFEEAITVTADTFVIDVSKTSTTTSISRESIEFIPRGRDFTNVVTQAAGATDSARAGGISIDGSTGLENRYIIDGIDTTDPQTGESAVPMRADFMEEVQVKSAGYAAEFGGSTGGVINAITRSGRNDWSGGLVVDYQDSSFNGDRRPVLQYTLEGDEAEHAVYPKDDMNRWDPGFYIGGPIARDHVWFFASYQPGLESIDRTINWVDSGNIDTYPQDNTVDYATANVTANFDWLLLKLGGSISPYSQERSLPALDGRSGLEDQDNYIRGRDGERDTYSLTADVIASDSFVVSARAGYFHTDYVDNGVNFPGTIQNFSTGGKNPAMFPEIPAELLHPPGWYSEVLIGDATAYDTYERLAWAVDATWFFNLAGDHSLKFGYQTEEISNDVRSGYNADRVMYYWDRAYTTMAGDQVRGKYGYFRLLNIATLGNVTTSNDAIFLQDSWMVNPNLTLNLGVRAEHERVPNFGATGPDPAIEFDYGDKIAPRFGFAWDITGEQKWKLYGSYGTYFDVMKYELPRGSFGGDKWVDYFYTLDSYDYTQNTLANGCTVGSNTIFESPTCPAGQLIEVVDRRYNAAAPGADPFGGSLIDPDLEPMEQWEAQIGLDHQLSGDIRLGARYIHKQLVKTIEDVGILVPGIGEVYYMANPGYGLTTTLATVPFPKAQREYDGFELTFDRRFSDNWALRAAYTYSRLWGNYSGLANSDEYNSFGGGARLSPNVSRLYDNIMTSFDRNGDEVLGSLANERPHQLTAQFLYSFPFRLTVGVNQYVGSGTEISEWATVPVDVPFMPYGRGTLGRTPTLTQTDLTLTQEIPLGGLELQLAVTVINLFDEDTEIQRWPHRLTQDLPITEEEFFAGGWDYEELVAQSEQDPAFNWTDLYQAPRELRVTFKLTF